MHQIQGRGSCPLPQSLHPPPSPPTWETPAEDHRHSHSHLSADTRTCAYSDAHRHTHRYPHTHTHTHHTHTDMHTCTHSHGQEPAHIHIYQQPVVFQATTQIPLLGQVEEGDHRQVCLSVQTHSPGRGPRILDPAYLRDQKRRPGPQLRPPHSLSPSCAEVGTPGHGGWGAVLWPAWLSSQWLRYSGGWHLWSCEKTVKGQALLASHRRWSSSLTNCGHGG